MASSKKAIVARLEEIKEQAAGQAVDENAKAPTQSGGLHIVNALNLAEEAAGLGLELAAKGGKP